MWSTVLASTKKEFVLRYRTVMYTAKADNNQPVDAFLAQMYGTYCNCYSVSYCFCHLCRYLVYSKVDLEVAHPEIWRPCRATELSRGPWTCWSDY